MSHAHFRFFLPLLIALVLTGCKKPLPAPEVHGVPFATLGVPMPTAEMLAAIGPENNAATHRLLPDSLFVVAGKPKQFLATPICTGGELLTQGFITQTLQLNVFRIDPNDVELFIHSAGFPAQAQAMVTNPNAPNAAPLIQQIPISRRVTVLTLSEPTTLSALLGGDIDPILLGSMRKSEGLNEYYDLTPPNQNIPQRVVLAMPDARTVIIAQGLEPDIRAIFSDDVADNAVLQRLKHTPIDTNDLTVITSLEGLPMNSEELGHFLRIAGEGLGVPEMFLPVIQQHLRALTLSVNVSTAAGTPIALVRVEGRDEKSAEAIAEMIRGTLISAQTTLATLTEEAKQQFPISFDFTVALLGNLSIAVQGTQVTIALNNFDTLIPTLAEWISTQQAIELEADMREQRLQLRQLRTQNLQSLAELCWSYYLEHKKFPADILDAEGKPLLSWRVALLPAMGGDALELYKQFKLDEPWDSETNLAVMNSSMPVLYHSILTSLGPPKTVVRFFNSSGTPFTNRDLKLEDIALPSTTLMYVIVSPEYAVEWSRPDSLEFDIDKIGEILDENSLGATFTRRIGQLPLPRESEPNFEYLKRRIEALVKGLPIPENGQ